MDFLTEEERDFHQVRFERVMESYASDVDRIHELRRRSMVSSDLDLTAEHRLDES